MYFMNYLSFQPFKKSILDLRADTAKIIVALATCVMPLMFISQWADQSEGPKWLTIYVCSIPLVWLLPNSSTKFSKGITLSIAFIIASYWMSAILNPNGFNEQQLLDWVCFGVIALSILSYGDEKFLAQLEIASCVAVIGIIARININSSPIAAGFGYQNFLAEFFGISTIIQFNGLLQCKEKIQRYTLLIFSIISAYLVISENSLAGILATGAGVFASAVSSGTRRSLSPRLFLSSLLITAFIFLAGTVSILNPSLGSLRDVKLGNLHTRMIRWRNTIEMIKENPLGVGPGNFEFAYLDYRARLEPDPESTETSVVESPHNGFLEVAAENGIPCAVALLFSLCYIFALLRGRRSRKESALAISLWVFILIDALFAFPMENAYPFLTGAIALGLTARGLSEFKLTYNTLCLICFRLAISATIVYFTYGFLISRRYEGSDDFSFVQRSCDLFPAYPENCLAAAELELQMDLPFQALETTNEILLRIPNYFPALLVRSSALNVMGIRSKACDDLKKYDRLFNGFSQVHGRIVADCL
jgi:O-antigen ligase